MKLSGKQIQAEARRVLRDNPEGIRWMDLLRAVRQASPETPPNTIHGATHALLIGHPDEIMKIERGYYRLAEYVRADSDTAQETPATEARTRRANPLREQDFYKSFATWLVDNEEATVAHALGGASLGGKWGTPDVLGVLRPRAQDIFKFQPQIITAEIKTDSSATVVAFGQAIAYRLFSHKTFIVVPNSIGEEDKGRLKSLCGLHGIGLVAFALNPQQPEYALVVPPVQASPDMFYLNLMLERLKSADADILNNLF